MDWMTLRSKAIELLSKYKYVALVLVIGLVLMLLPSGDDAQTQTVSPTEPVQQEQSVSDQLESVLSQIHGAGKVQVMLTVAAGEETLYQTNEEANTDTTDRDTVTITDADRNQSGLVRQVNPPKYQGAIVVCQGADDPSVKLAIVEAVSKVTGLGSDRISVLKMK